MWEEKPRSTIFEVSFDNTYWSLQLALAQATYKSQNFSLILETIAIICWSQSWINIYINISLPLNNNHSSCQTLEFNNQKL